MKTQTADYNGNIVRYSIIFDTGVLFNTADICQVLGITEIPSEGILSRPCMNIVGVIEAALTEGRSDLDFVDWIEKEFTGFQMRTLIRFCDEWSTN